MLIFNELIGFGAGVSVATSLSFLQGSMDISDLTTYTFSSQNLGSADANRWIIVCVGGIQSAARSISSVTVGGVSATKLVQAEGSSVFRHNSIWAAPVPSGATGDIVITWSSGLGRCGYSAYRLLTDTDPTTRLYDNKSDNTLTGTALSVSINLAGGGAIVAAATFIGSSANSCTWTGATEDFDSQWSDATSQILTSASTASGSSPITITATGNSATAGNVAMCAASFS